MAGVPPAWSASAEPSGPLAPCARNAKLSNRPISSPKWVKFPCNRLTERFGHQTGAASGQTRLSEAYRVGWPRGSHERRGAAVSGDAARLLPRRVTLLVFLVLAAVSVVAFAATWHVAADQEDRLLHEQAVEVQAVMAGRSPRWSRR